MAGQAVSRRRQIKKWKAKFGLWLWAQRMMEIAYSRAEVDYDGEPFWPDGGEPTKRVKRLADIDQDVAYHLDRLRAKNWRSCCVCGKKSNVRWGTSMCQDEACMALIFQDPA